MALNDLSKTFISLKKLSGKAHTSNEKELYNEALPTGVTLSSNTIFGQQPPPGVASPYPYKITNSVVEFLRLPVSFIAGTDTADGRHGFEIKLPSDYETESDNPKKGIYPFLNDQVINITSGSLQLVPPSFALNYEAKPYFGTIGSGSLIPVADARDWNLDYFNGVFFQQDPPGTGAHSENPDYIEAYLYIGDFLDVVLTGSTGDITGVTAGTGLSGGGTGGTVTLNLDLNGLSSGDADFSADSISFIDATDNSVKKETLANIFSGSAGAGLSSTDGVLSVDIDELAALGGTGIDQGDHFIFSDGGTEKKLTFSNLEDAIFANISGDATVAAGGALTIEANAVEGSMLNSNVAGAGLAYDSNALKLDLNTLNADNIDVANDFVTFIDATDSNATKKESVSDFITAVAGDGLTASSGVLAANVDDVGIEIDSDALRLKDSGVTLAKMANLADLRVIGNVSGGAAAPAAIEIDTDISTVSSSHDTLASAKAIKAYVDGQIAGLDVKASVVAATTASFTMASTASTSTLVLADGEGGFDATADTLTIDGVSVSQGDRVLIKDGVNSNSAGVDNKWNGVYTVGALSGTTVTLTRANDFDESTDFTGAPFFMVEGGTDNGAHGFVSNLTSNPTIGTDSITFFQFSAPGQDAVAGAGLAMTGNVLSLDIDELTALGGTGIDQTDHLVFSDAGTEKKITFSNLEDAIFANLSGHATVAAGGALTINNSVVATLTGSVFSGNVVAQTGLSGSIQQTADGLSYLVAGDGMSVVSASNGQITISNDYAGDDSVVKSATDGTSGGENITVANNDLILVQDVTDGSVKYVEANQLPGSAGGTIGAAEDGDYTDGLFTDFTTSTPVGTPVDRFNEILKLLVPAPAPDLDDIDSNVDGVDVKLSFGSSNDQSAASPAYVSVAASAGIAAAVDVNGDYATASNSNNLRAAVFDGTTDIIGDLNEDIPANITSPSNRTNYPANSFGNAELGTLILEVNGSDIHTIDLTSNSIGVGSPGSGTGNHVDSDGSGFINLSIAANGTFDNGTTFPNFKHRTGQFKVAAASQRNGWNYARVKHNNGSTTVEANYVEWVNDSDSNALAASSNSIAFTGAGSAQLSGVTYNASGTLRYQVTVDNAYRYVYDTTDTTFSTSDSGTNSNVSYSISNIPKASIDTAGGETHTKQIVVDETDNLTADYILGGSITAGVNVSHPLKSNLSNAGQASASGILIYNVSDSASVTSEPFNSETYRLQSGSYSNQTDVTGGTNDWDSSVSLVHGSDTGHNTGLQVYRERLYSPTNTLNSGDFRNTTDGGSLANGPDSNPNYSGVSGTRNYYRKFQNTTGGAVRDISYTIAGSGTLVGASDSIGSNANFKLSFRMPSDGSGNATGFLDAKNAFSLGSTSDGDGGAIGTVDTTAGMTNNVSFGTVEVGNNEFIVARIEADEGWTGYLDSFSVSFGAVGSVSASPNVDNIDSNQSGVDAKLSFGDTLSKAGYSTVENSAGSSEVNANGSYSLSGIRRGIFDGTTVIAGEINETTSASGNAYPANAFGGGSANQGTLQLEVNGSVVRTTDLSSFASGDDLNSNGSGFKSLSAATAGEDGSNLPDFTKIYRTGGYQVGTADQRSGWNYARVIHSISGTDNASTYVEWVNDDASRSIAIAGETIDTFAETGTPYYLSGVKYFVSPTAKFKFRIADIYKHVYSADSDAIDYPVTTNSTITAIECAGGGISNGSVSSSSRSLPNLDTSVSSAYDLPLNVTGSFTFDRTSSLPGETAHTATVQGRVNHPLAGDTSSSSTTSAQWLVYTDTDNSTVLVENFRGESRRLEARAYSSQSDVYVSNAFVTPWDSEQSLNGDGSGDNAGHDTGLMIYNRKLVSPERAGHSSQLGDFRGTVDNPSSNIIAPTGNPNYSDLTNTTRDYYRYFQNNAGSTKYNFSITINGTGTIVNSSTSLTGDRFRVFLKLPTTSTSTATGYLDLATAFANGAYSDNDGCFTGTFDSSLNATNTGTFGIQGVGANEYIIIKIVAADTWTGNISGITFSWS